MPQSPQQIFEQILINKLGTQPNPELKQQLLVQLDQGYMDILFNKAIDTMPSDSLTGLNQLIATNPTLEQVLDYIDQHTAGVSQLVSQTNQEFTQLHGLRVGGVYA